MATYVELVGPSGIGKSTLYNEIRKDWRPEYPWVCYHDLMSSQPGASDGRLKRRVKRLLGMGSPSSKRRRFRFRDYMVENAELVEHCWALCRECEENIGIRFAELLIRAFEMDFDLQQCTDERLVIVDEGFARRLVARWPVEPGPELEACACLVNKPKAVVTLNAPLEEVTRRIGNRNYQGESKEMATKLGRLANQAQERVLKVYRDYGVQQIPLDATRKPEQLKRDLMQQLLA